MGNIFLEIAYIVLRKHIANDHKREITTNLQERSFNVNQTIKDPPLLGTA